MERGKITKLAAWKSGKGFFIGIDGKDFIILAGTDAKVGDTVEYELGNKFVYGKQVVSKLLLPLEAYVQPARDEDRAKPTPVFRAHEAPKTDTRETYWQHKEIREIERDGVITMLSCISSASMVYEGAQGQDEKILALSEAFFAKANSKIKKV